MPEDRIKGETEFVRLYWDNDNHEFRAESIGIFDVGNTEESFSKAWDKHIDPLLSDDMLKGIDSQYATKEHLEELYFDLCAMFYIDEEED